MQIFFLQVLHKCIPLPVQHCATFVVLAIGFVHMVGQSDCERNKGTSYYSKCNKYRKLSISSPCIFLVIDRINVARQQGVVDTNFGANFACNAHHRPLDVAKRGHYKRTTVANPFGILGDRFRQIKLL